MEKQEKIKELLNASGQPKICVPITGKTEEEIFKEAEQAGKEKGTVDLAEWRMDYFEDAGECEKVVNTLKQLPGYLSGLPLIATFRTKEEGGEQEISFDAYKTLLLSAACSGAADFIDVEVYKRKEQTALLVEQLHQEKVLVIGSSHDFHKTPAVEEMEKRLEEMIERFKADIPKIAVMPFSSQDVAALLFATARIREKYPAQPVISMSMGGLGVISRMSGEIFGSAVTFASLGKTSAPGQLPAFELKKILEYLHKTASKP